jgi:hypothetical protein
MKPNEHLDLTLSSSEFKFWRAAYLASLGAAQGNQHARREARQAVLDLRVLVERAERAAALGRAEVESAGEDLGTSEAVNTKTNIDGDRHGEQRVATEQEVVLDPDLRLGHAQSLRPSQLGSTNASAHNTSRP